MATALRRRRTARRRTAPTVVHQLTQVAPRTSADVLGAARAAVALAGPLTVLVAVGRTDLTIYATFGAFAALHGRHAAPRPRRRMQFEVGATLVACVGIGTTVATLAHREWIACAVVAVISATATVVSRSRGWQPVGPLFPVFATAAATSVPADAARIGSAVFVAAAAALYAVAAGVLLDRVTRRPYDASPPGGSGVSKRAVRPVPAAAVGVAVLIAGVVPTAIGVGHPYWSAVAAAAVLSGPAPGVLRGLHRVLGTALGLLVCAAVLGCGPSAVVAVGLVVVLQGVGEYFVSANYAVALVFITPVALLMAELGRGQRALPLLRDRGVETVTGAVIAIAAILLAAQWRDGRPRRRPLVRS